MKQKRKGMSNAQITKAFGKRGSLHKSLGTAPGVKIGKARIQAAASGGSKAAKMAMQYDYRSKKGKSK